MHGRCPRPCTHLLLLLLLLRRLLLDRLILSWRDWAPRLPQRLLLLLLLLQSLRRKLSWHLLEHQRWRSHLLLLLLLLLLRLKHPCPRR